jgi:hypothetical protein
MHDSLQGSTFHVEHIEPKGRGGSSALSNLALSCPNCNLRKGDRTTAIDPDSGLRVQLFHPRKMKWVEHFRWNGFVLAGITDIGRATVSLLDLNNGKRLRIRRAEKVFELFPPPLSGGAGL